MGEWKVELNFRALGAMENLGRDGGYLPTDDCSVCFKFRSKQMPVKGTSVQLWLHM